MVSPPERRDRVAEFERAIAGLAQGLDAGRTESLVGARIGDYELVAELGRGGMGAVYQARPVDGTLEREVALKVLAADFDAESRRRFADEQRLLSTLNHPNIAQIYESGFDDQGRPFFAMELVEGERIDVYRDRHRLDTDDVLALIEQIAAALRHAHGRLVVHRDLKPSNILVRGDGTVKLVDFGIARAVDAESGAGSTLTVGRLTPQYAAPEQLRAEPISTATDVYQLGVVASELLTGHLPYRGDTGSAFEIGRAICDTEAIPPSRLAVRGGHQDSHPPAERRRLARRLRGDVDAIVLKMLRKDPADRYASAIELLADLQRRRQGLPVEARRGSELYRVAKFLRRNRLAFAAVVLAVLFAGYHLWRVTAERNQARIEARTSQRIESFLVDLFESADPDHPETDIGKILDTGAARIGRELAGEPLVEARLATTMGTIYTNLGRYDRASALLRRAAAIHQSLPHTVSSGDSATTLVVLAEALLAKGNYEEAEAAARSALRRAESDGSNRLTVAAALSVLGRTLAFLGRPDEAERTLLAALAIEEGAGAEAQEQRILTLQRLGATYTDIQRLTEAAALLQRAADELRQRFGNRHSRVAAGLTLLGEVAMQRGRFDEAERALSEALAISDEVLGAEHPGTAGALDALASLRRRQGKLREAEDMLLRALSIRRASLGTSHPSVCTTSNELGNLERDAGDLEAAVAYFEEALAVCRHAYPQGHVGNAVALSNLGEAQRARGNLAASERALREGVATAIAIAGTDGRDAVVLRHELCRTLLARGKGAEAEPLLRQNLEVALAGGEDFARDVPWSRTLLAYALLLQDEYEESRELLDDALSYYEESGDVSYRAATARMFQGILLARRGEDEAAIGALRRAAERLDELGHYHADQAHDELARLEARERP